MERKRIVFLFLFVVLILFFYGCHPRRVSDIKPNMTKEEVVSLWGKTPLIAHQTVDGKPIETWEYHFANSRSICWITFSENRVETTQCRPLPDGRGPAMANAPSEQSKPGQALIREGSFALKLAEVLEIGKVESEAEAENMLTSAGIAPRNGWIADYPVTPDIIGELQKAIDEAADSNKIAMNKDEAMKAIDDLIKEIESQYAAVEPPPSRQPYPEPYYYPYPYPYLYPYPFPYPFYYPYPYYRYHGYPHYYHRR